MTKVSRQLVNRKLEKQLVGRLWELIGALNKKEAAEFLEQFLTPTEVKMFSKRLEVLKRLLKNAPYSEIRTALKVTNTTVGRLSNIMQRSSEKFLSILARLPD